MASGCVCVWAPPFVTIPPLQRSQCRVYRSRPGAASGPWRRSDAGPATAELITPGRLRALRSVPCVVLTPARHRDRPPLAATRWLPVPMPSGSAEQPQPLNSSSEAPGRFSPGDGSSKVYSGTTMASSRLLTKRGRGANTSEVLLLPGCFLKVIIIIIVVATKSLIRFEGLLKLFL